MNATEMQFDVSGAYRRGIQEFASSLLQTTKPVRFDRFWIFVADCFLAFSDLAYRMGIRWQPWNYLTALLVRLRFRATWNAMPLQEKFVCAGVAGLFTFLATIVRR